MTDRRWTLPPPLCDALATRGWIQTGHRGAPQIAPGNTLRSITAAAELKVDLVEVDVRCTADRHLALWHDEDVSTSGTHLIIAQTPFDRLRALVASGMGERLVSLADGMRALNGKAGLMIDIKAPGLAAGIIEAIRETDFSPVVVCGEDWDAMREIKRAVPTVGISLTLDHSYRHGTSSPTVVEVDTDAVTISHRIASPRLISEFHARSIAVLAWTVDDPARMTELLAMGVDGITSNRPDLFTSLTG